jgi:molybdenum-dependent DNA-binding transcriptional regulator ModE
MICAVTRDLNRYLDEQERFDEIERIAERYGISFEEAEDYIKDMNDEFHISVAEARLNDY